MMDEIGSCKFYLNTLSLICVLFLGPTGAGKSCFFSSASSMITREAPKELIKQVWQLNINNCFWLIVSKLQMQSYSQKSSWQFMEQLFHIVMLWFILYSCPLCALGEFSAITCRKRSLLFLRTALQAAIFQWCISVLYYSPQQKAARKVCQKGRLSLKMHESW